MGKRSWKVELVNKAGQSMGFVGFRPKRCSAYTKKGARKIRAMMQEARGKITGSKYRVVHDPKGAKAAKYRKMRRQLERS